MYRMNGSFYEAPMSLLSSYETNRALLNGCADEVLSDEELAAELAPAATFLGALLVWLAGAVWRGLVALGHVDARLQV